MAAKVVSVSEAARQRMFRGGNVLANAGVRWSDHLSRIAAARPPPVPAILRARTHMAVPASQLRSVRTSVQ